jgi:hypothetical protein
VKLWRHVLVQTGLAILCYALLARVDWRIALAVFLVATGVNISKWLIIARTFCGRARRDGEENSSSNYEPSRVVCLDPYTGMPRTLFMPGEDRFPRILMPLGADETLLYTYDGGWNWQQIQPEMAQMLLDKHYVDAIIPD